MLYLYGEREVNEIFSNQNNTVEKIGRKAFQVYKRRPGFFTAYRDGSEFVGELVAPFIYPVAGFVVVGGALLATAISAIAGVGSFLLATGASEFGNTVLANKAFEFAEHAFHYVGVALLTAAVAAVLGALSLPHSLASVITRSIATAVAVTTGYTDGYQTPLDECDDDADCDRVRIPS